MGVTSLSPMHQSARQLLPGVACLLLGALTAAIYWPTHNFSFVNYDDPVYVTQNAAVQAGLTWEGVRWAFSTVHASNWHPLTWLSHMADVQLFGQAAGGHHLTSVVLHTASTVLVFLLLLRMTGKAMPSLLVASLFGWHPLHVESVAWISERKDALSACFWLLTLWFYVTYVRRPMDQPGCGEAVRSYLAALMCFALGLLSKPMVVTLPFVLLLLDIWPLKRVSLDASAPGKWRALLREKLPFFALAAGSCVLTFVAQNRTGAVASLTYIPLGQRVTNAFVAYAMYLRKAVWPADLAVFYPHPGGWPWTLVAWSGLGLGLITWATLWQLKQRPWFFVGWFWYLGTLIPVIGLVQVGNQAYADRYTYIPLIGVFIAVAWGMTEWAASSRQRAVGLSLVSGMALLACGVATHYQLQYWANGEALLRRALAVTDKNYLAHHNLAFLLAATGRVDEAQAHYEQALAILPNYYEAHLNLGKLLLGKGALDQAAEQFLLALKLNPDSGEGYYNYGIVLGRQGRDEAAIAEFSKAAELQPGDLNTQYNLGLALAKVGRLQDAELHYRQAIRLAELRASGPDARLALPHYNLGLLLQQQGRAAEAQEQFDHAARLRAMVPAGRN
jgi:protein O-mannosyl-transferase